MTLTPSIFSASEVSRFFNLEQGNFLHEKQMEIDRAEKNLQIELEELRRAQTELEEVRKQHVEEPVTVVEKPPP